MRILRIIFVILLLLGSCTSASRITRNHEAGKTKVRIDNQNVMSMTIYVLKGPERLRLGSVSGMNTIVFSIPDRLVTGPTSIRLLADPVGSSHSPISEEFSVIPGDVIEMVIRTF